MNKKILVSAVATTLAVGLAPAAQADDNQYMLLPYVVKDTNRTTVVTLMGSGATDASAGAIHLQYWTKSTTDANTAACQPNSVVIPFTPFDMVTFDTAGILGYPLFGDTTNPAPLGTGISYAAPRHGFLLAEGRSAFFMGGYWLELDLANGGAHGDRGAMGGSPNYSGWGDSSGFAHMLYPGDVGYFQYATPGVAFWPSSVASTAFTVTPGGSDMLNKENNQVALQTGTKTAWTVPCRSPCAAWAVSHRPSSCRGWWPMPPGPRRAASASWSTSGTMTAWARSVAATRAAAAVPRPIPTTYRPWSTRWTAAAWAGSS